VTQALLISYCSLPLKNQLLYRAGIQARALIYFMFCSHGRLFKQALDQHRTVKRVYTVLRHNCFLFWWMGHWKDR